MIIVSEALESILKNTIPTNKVIRKPLIETIGFILAENIVADRDYPPFPRATMDGYAVIEKDLIDNKEFTVIGEIFAGDTWDYPDEIPPNSCIKIMTGASVPNIFDTIIKVEDTKSQNKIVQIETENFFKGMNIAKQGEDSRQGSILVSTGLVIDTSIVTIAASTGYTDLSIYSPPIISILSTGNEVLPEGIFPLPHQIRDSNSFTLRAMLQKFRINPLRVWNLPDDPEVLRTKFIECFDSDICIITGGVSAGDADYIPATLKNLGVEEIFHKVQIRPGKPIWFGKKDNTLFFGLPGNPVSARVTFKIFVEPCIRKFLNLSKPKSFFLPLLIARKKKHNLEEYFRVKIVNQDNQSYLQEIPNNGSGDFIGSLGSDGLAIQNANNKELPEKTFVEFLEW
ncbi:MAG: molybdopterin molybdotransferase MoeA [Leptospiraceae bacterium]|nr:molybdopterin molybdotransferase MoeA [Leptospiraceae bacterium]